MTAARNASPLRVGLNIAKCSLVFSGRHAVVKGQMTPDTHPTTIPSAIVAAEAELAPGERLVWVERPGSGTMALRAFPETLYGYPYTALFLYFLSLFHWHVMSLGALAFCLIVVSVNLLAGLCFIFSPVFNAVEARKTVYAITDRRLFIISIFPRRRVDSYA